MVPIHRSMPLTPAGPLEPPRKPLLQRCSCPKLKLLSPETHKSNDVFVVEPSKIMSDYVLYTSYYTPTEGYDLALCN